ncbi:MAG: DUF1028 domain-containing protein [Burkholderiaceae bacterium]
MNSADPRPTTLSPAPLVAPATPPWDNTFSIVARDPASGALGVAVATARTGAGNRVPFLEFGVGVVATQANTNVLLAQAALDRMRAGASASDALSTVLADDPGQATRQLSLIDAQGGCAAFTGELPGEVKGHRIGLNCIAAGNLLASAATLDAMVETFEAASGRLGDRLLAAITAGQAAGGDRRGKRSAAIRVLYEAPDSPDSYARNIDLRVDGSADPIGDLAAIYAGYKAEFRID